MATAATGETVHTNADRSAARSLHAQGRSPKVHFGGPDRRPRALRNILEDRIDAVAPGGSIDWMTYYFRDEHLADALARAHRRGVNVRVCVEGKPRLAIANRHVIRRLRHPTTGIGSGLQVVRHLLPFHLHSKIYCFSDPRPVALVGSFNPSGVAHEPDRVISDIGDQDRGHNLLVELNDPAIVARMVERIGALHASGGFAYPRNVANRSFVHDDVEAVFFPMRGPSPLVAKLGNLPAGSTVRIAASHVRDPFVARTLGRLVKRGVEVTILTGHTMRRTPRHIEQYLFDLGVQVYRFADRDGFPMHAKFILAEGPEVRWCAFGSFNLTLTSRWLNHELLMFSSDAQLWRQLAQRWNEILALSECRMEMPAASPSLIPVLLEPQTRGI